MITLEKNNTKKKKKWIQKGIYIGSKMIKLNKIRNFNIIKL